jgi:hypothetical protein
VDHIQIVIFAEVDDNQTVLPELVRLCDGVEEVADGVKRVLQFVKILNKKFVLSF